MPPRQIHPDLYTDTQVKTTDVYSNNEGFRSLDQFLPLDGSRVGNGCRGTAGAGWKLNVDLVFSQVISKVAIDNWHDSGTATDEGIKTVILYGTDDSLAFENVDYADLTSLTQIASFEVPEHIAVDSADTQEFVVSGASAYRYYIFRIADNWGSASYSSVRNVQLYIEDDTSSFGNVVRPPVYDAAHVKASSTYSSYYPYRSLDPDLNVAGGMQVGSAPSGGWSRSWYTTVVVPHRFSIDFGGPQVFSGCLFENGYSYTTSAFTNTGVNAVKVYGTNSQAAFDSIDPSDLTDLTLIGDLSVLEHIVANTNDPQYFALSQGSFQYIVLVISSDYGGGATSFRHLEFFSPPPPPPALLTANIGFNAQLTGATGRVGSINSAIGFGALLLGYSQRVGDITAVVGFSSQLSGVIDKTGSITAQIGFGSVLTGLSGRAGNINATLGFSSKMLGQHNLSFKLNGKLSFYATMTAQTEMILQVTSGIGFNAELYGVSSADQGECRLPEFPSGRWA